MLLIYKFITNIYNLKFEINATTLPSLNTSMNNQTIRNKAFNITDEDYSDLYLTDKDIIEDDELTTYINFKRSPRTVRYFIYSFY